MTDAKATTDNDLPAEADDGGASRSSVSFDLAGLLACVLGFFRDLFFLLGAAWFFNFLFSSLGFSDGG